MDPKIIGQLKGIVGADHVLTEKEDLFCYTFDAFFTKNHPPMPGVVVLPDTTAEVVEIVRLANAHHIPLVPRGAGSNLTGGSLPLSECIVLQMTRMNRIIAIDKRNMVAVVEPGVITGIFQEALKKENLFYPPDPSSLAFSTMGGNVAECAGGPHGVKYGVTRDYILGLEVVLADGSIIKTGSQTMKSVAGYDLTHLFTGSEGTLGIVTRIIAKILPMPEARQTVLASFKDLDQATESIVEILARGIIPCALELIDKIYIANIEDFMPCGLPRDAEGVLLIEVDGPEISLPGQIASIEAVCREQGAIQIRSAASAAEREMLWAARRGAYGAIAQHYPTILSEDVTVPRDKIPAALRAVRKIAEDFDLTIAIIAHAGDGNFHASFCTDEKNQAEIQRIDQALPVLFRAALDLGGTITGEHGVGIAKAAFLPWEAGDMGMHVMQGIKRVMDPQNILNPGKMFGDRSW